MTKTLKQKLGDIYNISPDENKAFTEVTIKQTVDSLRIFDLLISAFEGGINYWCDSIDAGDLGHVSAAKALALGLIDSVTLHDSEEDKDVILSVDGMKKALAFLAEKQSHHFRNILDDYDAETADVFVQCAVFGDTVYG